MGENVGVIEGEGEKLGVTVLDGVTVGVTDIVGVALGGPMYTHTNPPADVPIHNVPSGASAGEDAASEDPRLKVHTADMFAVYKAYTDPEAPPM